MELSSWLAFLSASVVLAFAPGPDNIFVLLQSANFGVRSGLFIVLGLTTGLVFQTMAAALGLAAVVAASQWLFNLICLAGMAYLLWLAWGAWRAGASDARDSRVRRLTALQSWRQGTIMNVTNPKVQIFFLAFFPQFLSTGAGSWPVWAQMLLMGGTFILATILVFSLIAVFAGALSARLQSPRTQVVMNRVSAVIFAALAASAFLSMFSSR